MGKIRRYYILVFMKYRGLIDSFVHSAYNVRFTTGHCCMNASQFKASKAESLMMKPSSFTSKSHIELFYRSRL